MFYKNIIFIIICIILSNCTTTSLVNNKPNKTIVNGYSNKGFALIYSDNLYKQKIINKKIDNRSLTIFQKNLKTNTQVKITNILNNKTLIVTVGKNSIYPSFNNSVLSTRIAEELDLDTNQPYVEILEILENSIFIAQKAKMYDEEKSVAVKAPVNDISINDLNVLEQNNEKKINTKFSYIIKIADFYFNDTALLMINRIKTESPIEKLKIRKISDKKYRVYLGPFNNINSLQKSYNVISILEFENIEFIKND
tara:strand:- start:488 stop:1246 length:759 start_codon:yes stop_codon:yes gene_type:complete